MTAALKERNDALIGHEMDWTEKGHTIRAVVIDWRPSVSKIVNMTTGEEWPGVQFRMKWTDDAGKTHRRWTMTFPDREWAS